MSIIVVDSGSSGEGYFFCIDNSNTQQIQLNYKFKFYYELGYEENETDEIGYSMYYRYRICVTTGNVKPISNFGYTLRCPDGSNLDISSPYEYDWSPWIYVGIADYSINTYYRVLLAYVINSKGEDSSLEAPGHLRWSGYRPTFEIKFDCLGGIPNIDSIQYTWKGKEYYEENNERISLPEEHPSKNGYIFSGWKNIATEGIYYPLGTITPAYGGMTLQAVWVEREPQDIYMDNDIIYAREFIVEEALNTIEIDNRGNIYASAFINSDSCGIDKGVFYAVDFIEGTPS